MADNAAPHADAAATHDVLLARWTRLLSRCQEPDRAEGRPDPVPYGENLLARWAESHRHYHTTEHLLAVLDRVEELAHHSADPDAVRLAAWFHDAVYDPERSENEERSARLAERALPEAGVSAARAAEVARLVRLTVRHDPEPGDADGEVLCDADLAVLAGSPRTYAAYAAAVRQEYGFVPHDAFRDGRSAVLRELLELPSLFRTSTGRERWERTARYNLETELRLLSVS
ncbi:HD domain-containing protein [Streptomyces sp. NPDC048639]|uniref:HD domain-containing protein n=1 Tax=Streptomyces sp. NPDC048639 TaxID=3365581 RepID=UPI00371DBB5C